MFPNFFLCTGWSTCVNTPSSSVLTQHVQKNELLFFSTSLQSSNILSELSIDVF